MMNLKQISQYRHRSPEAVMIGGVEYQIDGDWLNCQIVESMLQDEELKDWKRAELLIELMYLCPLPVVSNESVDVALNYLKMNEINKKDNRIRLVLISVEKDFKYIYNAFYTFHKIDLYKTNLTHWHFWSLIQELPKDCFLCRLIYLRSQKHRGVLSKEEISEINRIGVDVVDIDYDYFADDDW